MDMPGIGLKTASLVLLFNFQKPVLPVDTHVHRMAQRVGMIPPKVSADKAHQLLLAQLPADALSAVQFSQAQLLARAENLFFREARLPAMPPKGFCNYYLEHYGPATPEALAATPKHWDEAWGKLPH